MGRLEARAPLSIGRGGAGTWLARRVVAAVIAVCGIVAIPDLALGYALCGEGRIERMDALMVWHEGEQVLSLQPHVDGVDAGAVFVLPVHRDALAVASPDPEMFAPSRDPAGEGVEGGAVARRSPSAEPAERETGREEGFSLPRASVHPRVLNREGAGDPIAAAPRAPRSPSGMTRLRLVRWPRPPLLRLDEPPRILFGDDALAELREALGRECFEGLPAGVVKSYVDAGWTFAVGVVPPHEGRARLEPITFRMETPLPMVPIRLAAGSGVHAVSMSLISEIEPGELGTMFFAFGLRNTQRPMPVDDALAAWARAVGFDSGAKWRVRGFSAGPVDSQRYPLGGLEWDLMVPTAPREAAEQEIAAKREEAAETQAASRQRSGCGCSTAASGTQAGTAAAFSLLVLSLAWLGHRTRGRRGGRLSSQER